MIKFIINTEYNCMLRKLMFKSSIQIGIGDFFICKICGYGVIVA